VTARTRGARRHHNTAAKIVGTVGVLGVAATIAGLTSFGSFTDSTEPVNTGVDTGVLSINVADAGDSLSMPFGGGLMLAGDSRSYRLDLVNDGSASLSTVTMTSRATTSSILDTDPVNGLQLTMKNCTVPWTVSGSVYSCGGTQSTVYSGPIVTANRTITGPSSTGSGAASTNVGGVDHLLLTASIPSSASGDAFEGATSSLDFVFTGQQRAGQAR
jgi:hypothetical protein